MFAGTPFQNATSEEMQLANENQSFWDQQFAKFNPQQTVLKTPATGPTFNNIAGQAQGVLKSSLNQGPTGTADIGSANRGIQNKAASTSKTEDLNNFLSNMSENQKSAEQRELDMFGNNQEMNKKNAELFQQAPREAALNNAKTATEMENMWQDYESGQPNTLNEIAGAAGGAAGKIIGKKVGNQLFPNNQPSDEEEQ